MSTLTEYLPTYYPPVHDQWVMIDGNWAGEANNCVAMTLSTIKTVHHYLRYQEEAIFSTKWIFGNRHSSDSWGDDGMLYDGALIKLRTDGVPRVEKIDNMFYENYEKDGIVYDGAKEYVSKNYNTLLSDAQFHRIDSYRKYDTYLGINSSMLRTIKQSIIDEGAAMLTLNLYDEFYEVPSSGIVPDYNGGAASYSLSVNGSSISHGAIGGSVSVPTTPVDPPPYVPPTDGYYGPEYGAGHSLVILGWCQIGGYDYWICQNSWGDWWDWGQGGRCFMRMTNPAIWSVYTIANTAELPQRIRGLSGVVSSNERSRVYLTWSTSSFATSYRINYRIRGSSTYIDAGGTTTNSYVVTGLQENRYYEFKVYGQNVNGNGEPAELLGNNAIYTGVIRPNDWSWYTSKRSGYEINITASEWNDFLDRIEEFRLYNRPNSSRPNYRTAYSGDVITDTIVNRALNAIRVAGGYPPNDVDSGDTITARLFNDMRDSLNDIN